MNYIDELKNNICTVVFTKVNGEARRMRCTLQENLLPAKETESTRKQNDDVVSVWDLENEGWRSFRKDSVVDFAIVLNEKPL